MIFALAGLALTILVMLLFGGMELDRGLLFTFYARDQPDIALAARIVTELGGWRVLVPVTFIGAAVLLWRRDWRGALLLVLLTASGRLAVELTKNWIGRVRPDANDHLVAVQSFSFPSGHAANSTLVWLGLALLLPRTEGGRTCAVWGAVWLALAIGTSRVVLGVHWPSDVIAGWAFGLFWALLLLKLTERHRPALPGAG